MCALPCAWVTTTLEDGHRSVGAQLRQGRAQRYVVDRRLVAYGEHRYGERKAIVTTKDWNGPSYPVCRNAAIVARRFARWIVMST